MACHGPGGDSTGPGIASIAGQPRLFIENQLVLIREALRPRRRWLSLVKEPKDAQIARLAKHFSNLPAKSMAAALHGVSDADIAAMSHYLSRLG
jgi:cytochrome c553